MRRPVSISVGSSTESVRRRTLSSMEHGLQADELVHFPPHIFESHDLQAKKPVQHIMSSVQLFGACVEGPGCSHASEFASEFAFEFTGL